MIIYGIDIRIYFLLFLIYSFLGWSLEVIGKLIELKRFINRGFLVGPVCPIYGCGGILITFLLKKYIDDPIALFIMAIFLCGSLEYLTSYLMEKIFHARWWDYRKKKYNINGRVCLDTIIPFGLLGMFIMYIANPFFLKYLQAMPDVALNILFGVFLTIFVIDNIVSTNVVSYVGRTTKQLGKELDNTEEITKKVKEIITGKSALYRRLLKAYPTIQSIKIRIKETQVQIKEQQEKIKENVMQQKQDIQNKIENIAKSKKEVDVDNDKK